MQLGLTVAALVVGVTVLFGLAGWLIDVSARHYDRSPDKRDR
jgi:hypothetical protein